MAAATIDVVDKTGVRQLVLAGDWRLATMPQPIAEFELHLRQLAAGNPDWELRSISLSAEHRALLERVASIAREPEAPAARDPLAWITALGQLSLAAQRHLSEIIALIGQLVLDLGYLCLHPREIPWREFSANLYKSGALALPVIALIGFLIGIVLSYLSALQLKTFGADVFIVNLLGISIVRELGPMLVAVLVAGRSGSAMTAQIGVMRVTEEIDALATMGVSRSQRLLLPKVLALAVAMPLLVIWCSAAGIIGGMIAAKLQMGLSYGFFIDTLPRVVPVANVWIGLCKGLVFGVLIALIACHFGLRVKPNTESLSALTTSSVVTSITVAIVVDAVFAVLTRNLGLPY